MIKDLFILLAVLAGFSFAKDSEKLPLPKELQAEELPWLAMDGTYGSIINKTSLKELAQKSGQRIVFAFFATWCVPCREGLKLMNEKAGNLKDNGVLVVLINVGEDDYGKVEKFANKYAKKDWVLGFDKFGNIPEKFGLKKQDAEMPYPRTLVLDSNLRPLMLIGTEGDDFPQVLWK
ncbi:MAG: TlpA family protein disulfide reductase [Fibromonadales bacterium]|nr:TlpA family protein disulfide reductase [Fibromonadales bacterium]